MKLFKSGKRGADLVFGAWVGWGGGGGGGGGALVRSKPMC